MTGTVADHRSRTSGAALLRDVLPAPHGRRVARGQAARHDGRVGRAPRTVDSALECAILDLLAARAATATICPSEAARRVATQQGSGADADWRPLMEPARRAARRLVERGEVEIVQRGRVVDPATATGPIRIRRAR